MSSFTSFIPFLFRQLQFVAWGIMVICVGASVYLYERILEIEAKQKFVGNEINSANEDIARLRSYSDAFGESYALWKKLTQAEQGLKGLDITRIQQLAEKYQKLFVISNMQLQLGQPQTISVGNLTNVALQSSEVTLGFSGVTDELLLSFVQGFLSELPGYVNIQTLELARKQGAIEDALEQIKGGVFPALVEGKIVFNWSDMKKIQ